MGKSRALEELGDDEVDAMTFPRRIAIVLVPNSDLETPALAYLLLHLNQLQRWFQYELYPAGEEPLLDTLNSGQILERSGIRDQLGEVWTRYLEAWASANTEHNLGEGSPDYLVIVSLAKFEDEYYSMRRGPVSVLGLGNWHRFMAPPSILEFVLTLVVRESFASISHSLRGSVHLGTKGCLFDFTFLLEHARQKVLNGFICAHCEQKLASEGYAQIGKDLLPVLKQEWIGKLDDPSSPASIAAALGFDLFRTKGVKPTFLQRVFSILEEEGIKELVKIVGAVVLAALLIWLGLKADSN